MRVRMKTLGAGPLGVWRPGEIIEVEPATGEQLVAGNYAERIDAPEPQSESMAAPDTGETTALRARGRRARKEI